jgi:hypothetical protein
MVGIGKTTYASTYKALDELYDLCSKSKEEGTLLRQTELESALLMAIGDPENNTCVITRSQPSQKEETPASYIIVLLNHADLDSIIDNINFYAMQKEISDFATLKSVIIYLMESQLIVEKIDKLKLIFNLDENLHAYVSLFDTLGRLILSLYRHAVEEIDAAKTLLIDSPSEAFPTIPTELLTFAFDTILEQYSNNPTSTYIIPMSLDIIANHLQEKSNETNSANQSRKRAREESSDREKQPEKKKLESPAKKSCVFFKEGKDLEIVGGQDCMFTAIRWGMNR